VATVGAALADEVDDGVEVLGRAPRRDRLGTLTIVGSLVVLHDGDNGSVALELLRERNGAKSGTRGVRLEVVVSVAAKAHGNPRVLGDGGPGEDGVLKHVAVADDRRALVALGVLGVHAVPEDDLVLGDLGLLAVLPPGDVVLGDDAPGGVVLAGDVGLHAAHVGVVGGGGGVAGQVAEVVGLAPVVPGEELDDVGLDFLLGDGLEALDE